MENISFGSYFELINAPSSTVRYLFDVANEIIDSRIKALKKNK